LLGDAADILDMVSSSPFYRSLLESGPDDALKDIIGMLTNWAAGLPDRTDHEALHDAQLPPVKLCYLRARLADAKWGRKQFAGALFRCGTHIAPLRLVSQAAHPRNSVMAKSEVALQAIGQMLITMFQDTVDQPLPPHILQLTRRLHEMTAGGANDEPNELPRPKKADFFLPEIGLIDGRLDG
jgi:hypothetical protein